MMPSRAEQVAQLQQFQQADLDNLYARLNALDTEIARVETEVLHATNVHSAARALVCARGGKLPPEEPVSSRARPKQRLWARADGTVTHYDRPVFKPDTKAGLCGVIYSDFTKRFEAPRQSFTGPTGKATVLITEEMIDFKVGERVWLVYWLDRNNGLWRHFVKPPRLKGGRVGVFATRSPNRPSPLGLSVAKVEDIIENGLVVSGVDILDETPLVGIRKYGENWPGVRAGWVDGDVKSLYYDEVRGGREVTFADGVREKLQFVHEGSGVDVWRLVEESLKREEGEGRGMLPVGAFRVEYVRGDVVKVVKVVSGMRREVCEGEGEVDPEARLHLSFQERFGDDENIDDERVDDGERVDDEIVDERVDDERVDDEGVDEEWFGRD